MNNQGPFNIQVLSTKLKTTKLCHSIDEVLNLKEVKDLLLFSIKFGNNMYVKKATKVALTKENDESTTIGLFGDKLELGLRVVCGHVEMDLVQLNYLMEKFGFIVNLSKFYSIKFLNTEGLISLYFHFVNCEEKLNFMKTQRKKQRYINCHNCGKIGKKLQICSDCKIVSYCSEECQMYHWENHEHLCKIICKTK